MPATNSDKIGAVLLILLIGLLILALTKYRQNRMVRLAVYVTMLASTAYRAIKNRALGVPLGLFDGFAMSFFGIAAVTEVIALVREKGSRG